MHREHLWRIWYLLTEDILKFISKTSHLQEVLASSADPDQTVCYSDKYFVSPSPNNQHLF